MPCDCGAATDRQQCRDCELAERYESEGFDPADEDYVEVFVCSTAPDETPEVYHTDRDCPGLSKADGVERRAERFVDESLRECQFCAGTISYDWSAYQIATLAEAEDLL